MVNGISLQAVKPQAAVLGQQEAFVFLLCKECAKALSNLKLPVAISKLIQQYTEKYNDIYDVGTVRVAAVNNRGKLVQLIIVGCGEGKECKPNNFRKAAGEAVRQLQKLNITQAIVAAPILGNLRRAHYLEAVGEGFYLGAYRFDELKSKPKNVVPLAVEIMTEVEAADNVLLKAAIAAEAVSFARDLVNRPGNIVNPQTMAQTAKTVAKKLPLKVEILKEKDMEELGMASILAVGQGSVNKPRMITLKYKGAGDNVPFVAYVGKGITFDSGGISIKPDDNMGEMKDDMTGAAVVLGAIKAIAELGLPVNLYAVLACAENMPGGNAQRPGDVVKSANGKTIEVISTDAEGRMVLADAVWYASNKLGAKKVVDIATLTGAVIIALGKETSGIVANDDELAKAIYETGRLTGESWWQLPSLPECKEAIKSEVADLKNSAGRAGGCITGGLFIGEFVEPDISWAHLDIGGTSTAEKSSGHIVAGGTAFGTLTLIKLVEKL